MHSCDINHDKSSGAMESVGAVEIFKSSIQKYNLIYDEYLGDGDTSSFKDVVATEPYKEFGIEPKKLECIGHVQKRVGTRLRNLVKQHKGTKTTLSGRGKLTEKIINSMQWHCCITDKGDDYRHRFCPPGETSWCKFKRSNQAKCSINLPAWIFPIFYPIFVDLSKDELLSKCMHGETQNANESFNGVIWTKCPKTVFVNKMTLEIGVYSAVLQFNLGSEGINSVLTHFGLDSGEAMDILTESFSNRSSRVTARKTSEDGKKEEKH